MFPLKDDIPTKRTAVVTIAIIALNVLAYFLWQRGGILDGPDDLHVIDYGAIPYEISNWGSNCEAVGQSLACEGQPGVSGTADPQPPTLLTLFTSMFMHGSLFHLGGNMLFLWVFGNNVEDAMGRLRFVLFYLGGGLAALFAQTLVDPDAAVPTVGASGAVSAVIGGYIVLYPHARVVTLIFIIFFVSIVQLPALVVLGLWFAQQVLFGYFELMNPATEGGGVAYFAHIGGFVCGLALIRLFARRRERDAAPSLGLG